MSGWERVVEGCLERSWEQSTGGGGGGVVHMVVAVKGLFCKRLGESTTGGGETRGKGIGI